MVLGGGGRGHGWRRFGGDSWPGHSNVVVMGFILHACMVRRAATVLVRTVSQVSAPCATVL